MPVNINGSSGIDAVQPGVIVQADLATNVAGNGPAFSAWQSVATSVPNATPTKLLFQTEEFDTASAFDSVTNSRFQPAVAGYYQMLASAYCGASTAYFNVMLYKNGTVYKRLGSNANNLNYVTSGSSLVYLNGTTDYVEIYVQQGTGSTQATTPTQDLTYFQGFLVRAA